MPVSYTPRDWSSQPRYIDPAYKSTALRGPTKPLIPIPQSLSELTGPVYGHESVGPLDSDLTRNGGVTVSRWASGSSSPDVCSTKWGGRCRTLSSKCGRPMPPVGTSTRLDQHDAPIDPNFFGGGRCVTDAEGRYTIPDHQAGRLSLGQPSQCLAADHIHFSLFGPSFVTRLVTQMYFPGDPLLDFDPIYQSVPAGARERLVSRFNIDVTQPGFALGYEFDIVLRGRNETPMEE